MRDNKHRIVSLLWIWIVSVFGNLTSPYDNDLVINAVKCLRQITAQEFTYNPRGFMIVTNVFNLTYPADEVQDEYFENLNTSHNTTMMTIGNDQEDLQWRKYGGVNSSEEHHEGEELGATLLEDVYIQSHLLFIRLADYYVMIVDSYRMYNSKIRQLVRVPSWNARAPMIIYCSSDVMTEKRMMLYPKGIFNSLWSYHVMNAILLIHDWKNRSNINIYSWNPYDPPKRCGEKIQNVSHHIELYDTCDSGSITNKTKLFPDKIPRDLQGCPITVLGVIWHPYINHNDSSDNQGLDREILNIISDRLNFTIDLDTNVGMWGERSPNGSWNGVMGGLKKSLGEVAIGAIYPDNDVHEDFDATLSYLQDSYVWIVPRARELPQWENLLIVLKLQMWMATGLAYLLCTAVWYIMSNIQWEDGIKYKGLVPSILDTWCINLSVSTVFRPNSDSFRVYFLFFCLYSMIWSTAYQTKLITVLTNPSYEHQITKTSELLKSNLKFGGNEAFKSLFDNDIDDMEDYIHSNYLDLNIRHVLDHVILHRNVSILTSKSYVRYLSATTNHYNDEHGVPLFYMLHTKVFSFPVEIVTVKGFAFLGKFNSLLSRMKSNGLVAHFSSNFKIYAQRSAANLAREIEHKEDENLRIGIQHLQGAFMALGLGTSISVVIFIAEILIYRRSRTKLKNSDVGRKMRWASLSNAKNHGHGFRNKKRKLYVPRNDVMRWIFWLEK